MCRQTVGSSGSGSSWLAAAAAAAAWILNAQQGGWENEEEIEKRGRGEWAIEDQKAIKAARIITCGGRTLLG